MIQMQDRKELIEKLETLRKSQILLYVTGDRPGWETQIHQEVHSLFARHLERIYRGNTIPKLSLFLYTRGGSTLAAWSLVNLLRQYCEELEIIIPEKAHSAGTLMCLGSNLIVMTKRSTLGAIDPSINTPLNPAIPNIPGHTLPVSVEAINGYIELIKNEIGLTDQLALAEVVKILSEKIHPLVLGEVYRARKQIKMLAGRLLELHAPVNDKDKIINFLCTDSGSHDYTINLNDARNLGLKVEEADADNAHLINMIHSSIVSELQLDTPFDPRKLLLDTDQASYSCVRAVIQSVLGGKHLFVTNGSLAVRNDNGSLILEDKHDFEGWRNEE